MIDVKRMPRIFLLEAESKEEAELSPDKILK